MRNGCRSSLRDADLICVKVGGASKRLADVWTPPTSLRPRLSPDEDSQQHEHGNLIHAPAAAFVAADHGAVSGEARADRRGCGWAARHDGLLHDVARSLNVHRMAVPAERRQSGAAAFRLALGGQARRRQRRARNRHPDDGASAAMDAAGRPGARAALRARTCRRSARRGARGCVRDQAHVLTRKRSLAPPLEDLTGTGAFVMVATEHPGGAPQPEDRAASRRRAWGPRAAVLLAGEGPACGRCWSTTCTCAGWRWAQAERRSHAPNWQYARSTTDTASSLRLLSSEAMRSSPPTARALVEPGRP